MKYTTGLSALFTLIAVSYMPVKADVVAFSGDNCDGAEGDNVPCDGGCIGFFGRHSIRVLAPGPHCLAYFLNGDCTQNVGLVENPGGGTCSNVNTGTAVLSFKCNANSVCNLRRNEDFAPAGNYTK